MKQKYRATSQLKTTLSDLDEAILNWEAATPDVLEEKVPAAVTPREEQARALKARARELIERLKEQLRDFET